MSSDMLTDLPQDAYLPNEDLLPPTATQTPGSKNGKQSIKVSSTSQGAAFPRVLQQASSNIAVNFTGCNTSQGAQAATVIFSNKTERSTVRFSFKLNGSLPDRQTDRHIFKQANMFK